MSGPFPRWVAPVYLTLSVLLIPWIVYLNHTLPQRQITAHYRLAWVGFDVILLGQLVRTGYLAMFRRTRPYVAHHATAAGVLLLVDAWFDTTTASTSQDLYIAIAMAALVEIPLAVLCRWLAITLQRQASDGSTLPDDQ